MDRFIATIVFASSMLLADLKSNMDRFIGVEEIIMFVIGINLKSNMDRFIGKALEHLYHPSNI